VVTALNGYSIIRRMKDEDAGRSVLDPETMLAIYRDA
jgi:hypothetical protein